MRYVYKILYSVIFFLTWPFWVLRDLIHHKPYCFKPRFLGPGRMLHKQKGRPRVWVWALSMGEILAIRRLVPALEEEGCEVIISSTTVLGRETAAKAFPGRIVLASPFDFSLSTRRFLDSVEPDLLVLVESDIWPGILHQMRARKLPKVFISARISPRSYKGYSYIKSFWSKVLLLFDLITAQSDADSERLLSLGANPETTKVVTDLKFDRELKLTTPESRAAVLAETGWPDGRWIVAGSIHMGEEALILDAFLALKEKEQYADLKLLLAPRNKSDFQAVWDLLQERKVSAAHREAPLATDRNQDIFLLDTLGELERFYDLADIALIGKTWAGQHKGGGHNPLEPASKGKPVLFGPQTHNYRWMTRALVAAGGALEVADGEALQSALASLLDNPAKIEAMGQSAINFVKEHQGGTARTIELLKPFLDQARQAD